MTLMTKDTHEKIFNFCKANTKLMTDNGWNRERFDCPCCDFCSINSYAYGTKIETVIQGFVGYILHLNAQIRLHASASHIKIFEQLFGTEKTNEHLRLAIYKNKAVTKELERIYDERIKLLEIQEVMKK